MEAAVLKGDDNIVVESRYKPEPEGTEIRINVKRCGVCMTDVHVKNGAFSVDKPIVLGHEFAGVVDKVGEKAERFDTGDKVAANPIISCGYCDYCKQGRTNFCKNAISLGGAGERVIDGGFQEFTIAPERNLEKLNESVSFAEAAFAEPLACAVRGINRLQINPGAEVLLIGAGPMGLLLLQLLKKQGAAKVFVSELVEKRRELATELGADVTISPKEGNVPEKVSDLSAHEEGVDIAIEAVGSKETTKTGIRSLRRGGKMLVFGVPPEEAEVPVNIFDTYYDEIDLLGSFALTRKEFLESIALLNNKELEIEKLISDVLNLGEINRAIELAESGQGMKKQIKFD